MAAVTKHFYKYGICLMIIGAMPAKHLFAQMEFKPWGNFNGIRIKGQLMEFNTRIVVVGQNWKKISFTGKEMQQPKYIRKNKEDGVTTQIGGLQFVIDAKDQGNGKAELAVKCSVQKDTTVKGVYLNLSLPEDVYGRSMIGIDDEQEKPLDEAHFDRDSVYFSAECQKLAVNTGIQKIDFQTDIRSSVFARLDSEKKYIRLYIPICSGKLSKGNVYFGTYHIKVQGEVDHSMATLKLDTSIEGSKFAGFGGNFRIQNPQLDPKVIDYCLENMRVAWGRVEMPWSSWQPDSSIDPSEIDSAKQNIRVRRAMEMAQKLSRMNIPVILTAWFPPAWAVEGKLQFGKSPEGIWGNPLKRASMPMVYKSIADYLIYLKKYYGVEVQYFSFNESDLGINIRQTGEEHDELIKGLGTYFASRGLKTKLLLGDNSDATTYRFIYPAMNDPETRPFIGAISFHSWRGWDNITLQKWADAAKKTHLPLIVGEGSIDAAAWAYPAYFEDPSYALEEINLYIRLLSICQPLSILQWQLTADYSPLKGGGIFGVNGPLQPTQRFWNLKQLSCTPGGLFYMPLTNDKTAISCAAVGDNIKHLYTIHIVNSSASRKVHITGLPESVKKFELFETNEKRNMKRLRSVRVSNHEAYFNLDSRCFTTLISN